MFGVVVETGHALSLQSFDTLSLQSFDIPCLCNHSACPVSATFSGIGSPFSAFYILTAPTTALATTALNRATDPLSSGCTRFVSRITAIL